MMRALTSVTMLVLVAIFLIIEHISSPPTSVRPAALPWPVRATSSAAQRPPASATASASPTVPASRARTTGRRQVTDSSTGLSYQLLSSPWRRGCPYALDTPMFSWSAGESAIAGLALVAGAATDWYGNACSGLLQQEFQYSSAADLEPTATSLADALDLAYYSGLPHYLTVVDSSGMQVSGHQAWVVTFLMSYPAAGSGGPAWTSEAGAVVLVDRGAGQAPALFYVSVPSNLGTSAVGILLGSLRLSSLA
jgi:hypothetical protein